MFDFERGPLKLIRGGKYPHCHTLFIDDAQGALIDAASKKDILKALNYKNPIRILINSHGHEDHFIYNYLFPKAQRWVHEADAPMFRDINKLIDCYDPTPSERNRWRKFIAESCHYEARDPDRLLKNGDEPTFGTTRCRVIHTPGHTPGHCAFHFPEERVLFTADLDLVKAGPYYGDMNSSIEDTLNSLECLTHIDADVYLSSHGRGIHEGNPERFRQYAKVVYEREEKLLEFLADGPKTLKTITEHGIIYGPPRILSGWDLSTSERAMMKKHLQWLEKKEMVHFEKNRFYLTA
jgi:glyoxylase-like metal-dependent hydrolase (beta-lactamase superfamily II)